MRLTLVPVCGAPFAGLTVHYISMTTINDHQCDDDWQRVSLTLAQHRSHFRLYEGTMQQQLDAALNRTGADLSVAVVMFTALTMRVKQDWRLGTAGWENPPMEPMPEESALSFLVSRRPSMITIAVTDDIHHLRVAEVLAEFGVAPVSLIEGVSRWVRQREVAFYSAVNHVVAVSVEDASQIRALATSSLVSVVPFRAHDKVQAATWARRRPGLLYTSFHHPLAAIAFDWLLTAVQPRLAALAATHAEVSQTLPRAVDEVKTAALLPGGLAHIILVGPGWDHAAASGKLNNSVAKGHVSLVGAVSEARLQELMQQQMVFASPAFNVTGKPAAIRTAHSYPSSQCSRSLE